MLSAKKNPLIIFLIGVAGGICLSLIIGRILLYLRAGQTVQTNSLSSAQVTNIFLTTTPEPTHVNRLDEAESALNSGQPEKVRDLLFPTIGNWISNDDRIRGYRLLGEAELAQGHPQLAAPYFEKLYFYQPTPENLLLLATIYDAGGDIRKALIKYQELARWENLPPEIDSEFIHARVQHISLALGTPAPTQTPTP